MSEIRLTDEQLAAVNASGGAVLVSAAAGSGKTKVLVERLLRKITDREDPCNIDDFLLITYTNAAASEMRAKIMDAIYDRIADDPSDKHLRRQTARCSCAEIETIHSFCAGIIRENAHILGISPDFRMMDDTESNDMKAEVLEDVLEKEYDSADENFCRLADTMGAGRDDSALAEIILDTHVKLLSHPYPEKWVNEQLEIFNSCKNKDTAETPWGKVIIDKAVLFTDYWIDKLSGLLNECAVLDDFGNAYGDSLNTTYKGLLALKSAFGNGWKDIRDAMDIDFPRPRPVKGYDDLKAVRNRAKTELKKMAALFSEDSQKAMEDIASVTPEITALLNTVLLFEKEYSARKRSRGVLDFSDQEHMALTLLVDGTTGVPTPLASEIAERYREIMVDEYQDVNRIQEMIFGAVSRNGKNIFMVGDVKQSIYRFRLADPTIFLEKYRRYAESESAEDGEGRKIILSRNFRSRAGVLDAVNFVFSNTMSVQLGDLDYTEKEALYPGMEYPPSDDEKTELYILDLGSDEGSLDRSEEEARLAARRISELVGSMTVTDGGVQKTLTYGDIVILMRSPRGRTDTWVSVLSEYGIPVATDSASDFFSRPEVSIAVSLLAVIDNPRQDIPLVSVLRSPLYGFTSEELGKIRLNRREGDYYSALLASAENDERCAAFINDISTYRRETADMSADQVLWYVFGKTGLFAAAGAMPDGEKSREGIMGLIDCAAKYEHAGYKGLFGFVTYVRKLMESGKTPEETESGKSGNAVHIMSMHKSKGLEFPVVILANLSGRFNLEDSRKPLLIHPELGVGPKVINKKRRLIYPTVARRAIKEKTTGETLSEELRVLYVAMTRAREKLIMICSYPDAEKEVARLAGTSLPVSPQLVSSARSMADWILMPALCRPEAAKIPGNVPCVPVDDGEKWRICTVYADRDAPQITGMGEKTYDKGDVGEKELEELREKLTWIYPHADAVYLPSKVTATELKGGFHQQETAEDADKIEKPAYSIMPPERPELCGKKRSLTPAQKGTAAHLVMQYADYERCVTESGAAGEIERLRLTHIISDEQAAAVRPEIISGFFTSEAGKQVIGCDKLWRELKFSLLVPSDEIPGCPPGEELLLQGVVDCLCEKDGALTVIDFKTDRVTDETARERAEYYRGQVEAYRMAMERIMKKHVDATILYFLTAGISITL